MTRPTIRDVALKAGVGIGTVSRVLNNSAQVSPETRQRVLAVMEELDFKPNNVARQLPRRKQLHNIGVITQPFYVYHYHSFVERLRGIQHALRSASSEYEVVVYNVSSLSRYDDRIISIAQTHPIDALLIIDLDLTGEQVQVLEASNMPFVGINHFRDKSWPCVGTNNIQGGYLATQYLLNLGHRKIGYIGDLFDPRFEFQTSTERFQGYQQALSEAGITFRDEYVCLGPHGYNTAKDQTAQLLRVEDPPTAVVAISDTQAVGCITAVREAGLRVPEDISVIGYDDLEWSHHTGLTTVRQHLELSGKVAVEYLLYLMRKTEKRPSVELPPLEIVARSTTARLS